MLVGALGYKVMGYLSFITPYLIFTMLLLTFSKISLRDLRPRLSHLYLLCIEIIGAIAIYYLLAPFDPIVAQGMMICIICPTATAAAVVTSKLGGNVASITTYTLLCNIAVAFVIPILFPIITEGITNFQLSTFNSQLLTNSTYLTSWDIGIGFGLVIGGIVSQHTSFAYAYLIGGTLCLISAIYFTFYVGPHFNRHKLR